jgi:hypothetical protein
LERVAELPHEEGPFAGTEKRLSRMSAGAAQDRGQSGGHLRQWCEDINRVQKDVAYDFVYVDEESFEKYKPTSFRQLLEAFKEYKEKI